MFQTELAEKIKHMLNNLSFFFDNLAIYEKMWKNMERPDRLNMTIWYGACALYSR